MKRILILALAVALIMSGVAFAQDHRVIRIDGLMVEGIDPSIFTQKDLTERAYKEEEFIRESEVEYEYFGEETAEAIRSMVGLIIDPAELHLMDFYTLDVRDWKPFEKKVHIYVETEGGYSIDSYVIAVFGVYDEEKDDYDWLATSVEVVDETRLRIALDSDQVQKLSGHGEIVLAILTESDPTGRGFMGHQPPSVSPQLDTFNQITVRAENGEFEIRNIASRFKVIDVCTEIYQDVSAGMAAAEYFPEEIQKQISAVLSGDETLLDMNMYEVATLLVTDYLREYGAADVEFEFVTRYTKDQKIAVVLGVWDEEESDVEWMIMPSELKSDMTKDDVVTGSVNEGNSAITVKFEGDLLARMQEADTVVMFVFATK